MYILYRGLIRLDIRVSAGYKCLLIRRSLFHEYLSSSLPGLTAVRQCVQRCIRIIKNAPNFLRTSRWGSRWGSHMRTIIQNFRIESLRSEFITSQLKFPLSGLSSCIAGPVPADPVDLSNIQSCNFEHKQRREMISSIFKILKNRTIRKFQIETAFQGKWTAVHFEPRAFWFRNSRNRIFFRWRCSAAFHFLSKYRFLFDETENRTFRHLPNRLANRFAGRLSDRLGNRFTSCTCCTRRRP